MMAVGITAVGIYQIRSLGREIDTIAQANIPMSEALTALTTLQLEQELLLERSIRHSTAADRLTEDERKFDKISLRIRGRFAQAAQIANQVLSATHDAETTASYRQLATDLRKVEREQTLSANHGAELIRILRAGDSTFAASLFNSVTRKSRDVRHDLNTLRAASKTFGETTARNAEAHERAAFRFMLVLTGAGTVIGLIFGFTIVRMALARTPFKAA